MFLLFYSKFWFRPNIVVDANKGTQKYISSQVVAERSGLDCWKSYRAYCLFEMIFYELNLFHQTSLTYFSHFYVVRRHKQQSVSDSNRRIR